MRGHRVIALFAASTLAWGAFLPLATQVVEARAETSALAMMWETPIGEGAILQKYTKSFADQQISILVTKVDLTNPYAEVKPIYGTQGKLTDRQTITQMAKETGAVAAINADFFNMTKRGAPFGIVMKDKELVSSMGLISYWYSLGITSDKTAAIEHFGFTGKATASTGVSYPIQGVNKEEYNPSEGRKSHVNQLNLYTPRFGQTSLGSIPNYKDVVEVVFVDNVVKEMRMNQPGAFIPYNGFVLWGNGAAANFLKMNFQVGSSVTIDYQTTPNSQDWAQAVGGGALLVNQGRPLTSFQVDKSITSLNARTAVGVSQDGKTLYMVTIDGTKGVFLDEIAKIMAELGAYRAVNLDGGGSTTMSARMLGDTQAKMLTVPKGGSERRVPTGLAVYNTAPPGTLAGFQINGPSDVLIGQTVEYSTKAYDNHYLPYLINPSDITWEPGDSDAGSFSGQQFMATRPGDTSIVARVGSVTQERDIHVISGNEVAQVVVSPNPINLAPGQKLTLDVKVKTRKGQMLSATPLSVQATVDSPQVTVDDKLQLTAGEQGAGGKLTVTYEGVSTTVPITVGQIEQPWLTFDNQTGMSHVGYPSSLNTSGSFTTVTEPVYRTKKAAKLAYNFANAPASDVRIAYGRIASQPVTIPGNPIGLGLWAYGDGSRHWLRAEVIDAKGNTVYVDLAKEIDWTGWKQVKGYFPGNISYPAKLKSIYVVNRAENEDLPVSGTLFFDEVSLLYPYDASKLLKGKEVTPAAPGTLSLGNELDLQYSFAKSASYLDKAYIDVKSNATMTLEGYVPADYSFTIKPIAIKPGKTDQFTTSPAKLTLVRKNWIKGKGVGLLYVNEANQTLDPLLSQVDQKGNWIYEVNAYGTYIPYYIDKPSDVAFIDIIDHPARNEITSMANRGLVKGLTEDLFGPEVSLTRAQYVALLARTFQWQLPANPKLSFKDKVPAYAQGAVQVAVAKGLVKGYPDKTFRPDQLVTRAEAAAILDRILQKKAKPAKPVADQKAWPKWAVNSINNIVGLGLMDASSNKFDANKPTSRAVCVVALYRVLEKK